ncbi:MAG: hypothetical protein PHR53_09150, partial [Bacteroidales bacterium]|nr:hypothetical protein [Bacteroidales bacterium]
MKFKHSLLFVLFLLASTYFSYSQSLNANMKYAVFYSPEVGPYVETYLLINGTTVTYRLNAHNKMQGAINLSIVFQQNDTVANYSKIQLQSPEIDTTDNSKVYDFMDYQRFTLANGTYEMVVRISDAAHPEKEFEYKEMITIEYHPDKVYVSSIELLDSYEKTDDTSIINSKNGFKLLPKINNFYPETTNRLSFYCEFYNVTTQVESGSPFLVQYYIRGFESQQQLPDFSGFKRMKSSAVNVMINNIDITSLASGNYELVVELKDRNNQLLAKNIIFFQRSNPNIQYDT